MSARAPSDPETAMILGEIRGQLREMNHSLRNEEMKNETVAKILAKLETLPGDIIEIKTRLTALETDRAHREGERGLLNALLRSPLVQWAATVALAAYVWWKGQGNG